MSGRGPLRIGVVGLGTVGRRVARAIQAQPDMVLAAVATPRPSLALATWPPGALNLFALDSAEPFEAAGLAVRGGFEAFLTVVDVVVDCGPRGTAPSRQAAYAASGKPVVYQGGEEPAIAAQDFCAVVSFAAAAGQPAVRVVSCNTTGLVRLLEPLRRLAPIVDVKAVLVRCATDPDKGGKGVPNALSVHAGTSHHARDVARLLPDLPITTLAATAPTNRGHVALLFVTFAEPVTWATARSALAAASRVVVLSGGSGDTSDLHAHVASPVSGDALSVLVWEEGIQCDGERLSLAAAIHMEAIVVPDTIDALRAVTGLAREEEHTMQLTDRHLGVRSGLVSAQRRATA